MGAPLHGSGRKKPSARPRRSGTRAGFAQGTGRVDGGTPEIAWRAPALSELHPLVRERLTALGIRDLAELPDLCSWESIMRGVSECVSELERNLHRLSGAGESPEEQSKLVAAERSQRASLERELRGAANVQRQLMPPSSTALHGGVALTSLFRPAHICGGDWWSWFGLPDGTMLVVIADVTGHGFAPAMMTGVAKGAADAIVRMTPLQELTPAHLLRQLNLSICDAGPSSLMMTCAVAHIDLGAGEVRFASAGHPLPYVIRPGASKPALSQLVASGDPLGTDRDTEYEDRSSAIQRGDSILWYTDGLTEATNQQQDVFGDKRLRAMLGKVRRGTRPDDLRDALWRSLLEFLDGDQPDDDITFVVTRMDRAVTPSRPLKLTFR